MTTILYLYHTSSIGGGSYCLLNILKAIDRSLFRPVVLLKEEGPLVDELYKLNIQVYFLKELTTVPYNSSTLSIRKLINAKNIICGLSKFKTLLLDIRPDIVYINTMMLYPFLRPAKQLGIKTIIHIREHWPKNEHKIQRTIALTNIKKYSDHIVAINSYSASMVSCCKVPTTIIYDWIDLSTRYEDFSMDAVFGEQTGTLKIYLYLGGLQSIKGTYEVIKSFTKIVKDKNSRLLILGINNPDYLYKGIKGYIKRILSFLGYKTYSQRVLDAINSDERIRYIGGKYKLNNIIQQSYCILSYFKIPHANLALAESIILGTPSIAARTPESLEYSNQGELASLFSINDISDFEKHIEDFDKIRDRLVEEIKLKSELVSRMFDPLNNSNKLQQIYNNI